MGGGTPVGGAHMRQRHSQGYASGSDDLEDDACSRSMHFSQPDPQNKSWIEVMENILWLASAVFIVYFGDGHSNFFNLLWHDERIKRLPFYLGMVGVGINCIIFVYSTAFAQDFRRLEEKWDLSSFAALPVVTILGLISFCLFSFALWPIWSFLTLPLLFTLFMACMVICPHIFFSLSGSTDGTYRID